MCVKRVHVEYLVKQAFSTKKPKDFGTEQNCTMVIEDCSFGVLMSAIFQRNAASNDGICNMPV